MRIGLPVAMVMAVLVYGCVAPRERAPETPPRASVPAARPGPVAAPPAPSASASVAPPASWADLPDTPGAWRYEAQGVVTQAVFASGAGEGAFLVRCDPSTRLVRLLRAGNASALAVRTSSSARTLTARAYDGPGAYVGTELQPSDSLLDAMAFSRGHFTVDAPGLARLVLPAHPEVARVVEDCRT